MDVVISLLQQYWGIGAVVVGFGVYAFFNLQSAKKIILSVMLQLEKNAEALVLSTGEQKFDYLVTRGYQILPQSARVFITPAMFSSLAQTLYDRAKKYLEIPVTSDVIEKDEPEQQTA
ncbi:hypothetical protein [Desulfosporosinus sp. FKA]|uniref:hypothetical protein n=1 Tax=Desulfosporosinus sp. FKA TaxID=1969834 RepID=UPI000B49F9E9|nr:hypothetical protein [Desulfosporosinus sp. FKA]